MTSKELMLCAPGTVLVKGQRKRIYVGCQVMGGRMHIAYKTPSQPKKLNLEIASGFDKWLKGAELERDYNQRQLMQP